MGIDTGKEEKTILSFCRKKKHNQSQSVSKRKQSTRVSCIMQAMNGTDNSRGEGGFMGRIGEYRGNSKKRLQNGRFPSAARATEEKSWIGMGTTASV